MMSTKRHVVEMFKKAVSSGNFNRVLSNVEISDVSKGRVVAEFTVTPECTNVINMLHGGFSATLFDHISTLALRSHFITDNNPVPSSVSVDLSLSYISSVKEGQTVRIMTETIKVGNKIAFLSGMLYNKSDSYKLVAVGKHTKYLLHPPSKSSSS